MGILGPPRPRSLAAAAFALASTGCDPEIVSDAYYCGPEMSCPPDLVCSPATAACVRRDQARPFACPPDTELAEPDDDVATAPALAVGCPATEVLRLGCVPVDRDRDAVAVTAAASCAGWELQVDVRFPAAFAPVVLEHVAGESVVAAGAPCDVTGGIGLNDAVCLTTTLDAEARAVVRASIDAANACDGACDFTHYEMRARVVAP